MNREFRLSAAGLQNLIPGVISSLFDFIVEGKCYHLQMLNAIFLSPRLARLCASDATICQYEVITPNCCHCFKEFLLLGQGYSVTITEDNYIGLFQLSEEFENYEILSFVKNYMSMISESDTTLTISVALEHLRIHSGLSFDISKEVEFIASHLKDCSIDELRSLPIDCLAMILSNERLTITTEDFLCKLVMELGSDFFSLFEFIHFEFISSSIALKFVEVYESCLHLLNFSIWKSICSRFVLPVVPTKLSSTARHMMNLIHISSDASGWLNGIIHYLQDHHCTNFSVVPSTTIEKAWESRGNGAEHAIQLEDSSVYFVSENIPNQWLRLDFQDMRVRVLSYTLRTHVLDAGYCHLKNWVIEGSLDSEEWIRLDTQNNNGDLNGKSRLAHFKISGSSPECRYVRVRSTGLNHQGAHYLVVGCFELFGDLINYRNND
jgi:hypothetical protein